jgi:hypothetical protein
MTPRNKSWLQLLAIVLVVGGAQQIGARWHSNSVGEQVAQVARPGDIHMICHQARQWFVAHAIPFTECTIERDAACRAAFDASGAPGTPLLVVRGKLQLGFEPRLLRDVLGAGA